MSRTQPCGRREALVRLQIAEKYAAVAELAATDEGGDARTVAVGLYVLAAIAASDAICCRRLGYRPRGQDHAQAAEHLRTADETLVADLRRVGGEAGLAERR